MATDDQHELLAALRRSDHRLTDPRINLARLIARHSGHFTAAELLAETRASRLGIGRATVFRALELFAELGVLERIDLPSGEHAYVACEPEQHHHHVVCERCGTSVEIDDHGLQSVLAEVGRRTGFQIADHRLELFGVCPSCRAAA